MEFLDILEDDSLYQSTIKEHLKERKIIVNETIDDNVIENICLMIMKWNKEDKALPASCRKPIYLYLNSDGGDVISGYQVLSSIKTSVTQLLQWDLPNVLLWHVIFWPQDINVTASQIQ